jgi:transposase
MIVDLFPDVCGQCHAGLSHAPTESDPEPRRHQVLELPPRFLSTTEYRCHARTCSRCHARTWAALPPGVPTGVIGFRLQAFCALMVGRYQVSRRALVEWLADVGGEAVSLGCLSGLERRTASALLIPYEQARQAVLDAAAVNVDESPWREGTAKGWLWAATIPVASLFRIDPKRSRAALERLLPPVGEGRHRTVTSDRHRAYLHLQGRERQVCWSHLARDFQALAELRDEAKAIGEVALEQTRELFRLWHAFRRGEIDRGELARRMRPVQARLGRLLRRARDTGHWKAAGLGRDLLRHWKSLFTFVTVEGVEPTNNAAERAIRPAVLWRKRSFGHQSERGRAFVERMLTVVGSLRQQGRNVLEYLEGALRAAGEGTEAPALVVEVAQEPLQAERVASTRWLSGHEIACLAV